MRSTELQVHYLGSSADLVALRRSLESRGVVSRSRLTPGVTAVVADAGVPADHPTLSTARELGIDVLAPTEAIDRFLNPRVQRHRAVPLPVASTPLITVTVLLLIGALALLGYLGALPGTNPVSETTNMTQVSDDR
jgi:hypothetical protein